MTLYKNKIMPHYKKIYIYRESRLPEDGWLQPCFYCYAITSGLLRLKTKIIFRNLYEIEVYLCHRCKITLNKNDVLYNTFIKKCNNYINNNIKF